MWVAYDLLFDVIVGDFSAPRLCPSEKDALIARITIEHRRWFSFERSAIGIEREREAAKSAMFSPMVNSPFTWMPGIGSYFEYCAPSTFGSRLKCVRVFLGPPIAQRAGCIDLAALIVEPVGQLMTDDAPAAP